MLKEVPTWLEGTGVQAVKKGDILWEFGYNKEENDAMFGNGIRMIRTHKDRTMNTNVLKNFRDIIPQGKKAFRRMKWWDALSTDIARVEYLVFLRPREVEFSKKEELEVAFNGRQI